MSGVKTLLITCRSQTKLLKFFVAKILACLNDAKEAIFTPKNRMFPFSVVTSSKNKGPILVPPAPHKFSTFKLMFRTRVEFAFLILFFPDDFCCHIPSLTTNNLAVPETRPFAPKRKSHRLPFFLRPPFFQGQTNLHYLSGRCCRTSATCVAKQRICWPRCQHVLWSFLGGGSSQSRLQMCRF